jgi:hypothetical protein
VALNFVGKAAELLYLGAMSDVASICSEFGIAVVPPCRRRTGGAALETCAASTLQRLLSDWGESHLREVLLSIVESADNERALTAPVIWAVSDLLLAHPNWFGGDWLDALDKIDLSALYENVKANRKAVQPRAAIAAILFEQLRERLPVTRRLLYRRSRSRTAGERVTGAEIIRARVCAPLGTA